MDYDFVAEGHMTSRPFKIKLGGQMGDTIFQFPIASRDVTLAIEGWQNVRIARGSQYLNCVVSNGEAVHVSSQLPFRREPVILISGDVAQLYAVRISDEAATETINNLAAVLGQTFGQDEVSVTYGGKTWLLRRKQAAPPQVDTCNW